MLSACPSSPFNRAISGTTVVMAVSRHPSRVCANTFATELARLSVGLNPLNWRDRQGLGHGIEELAVGKRFTQDPIVAIPAVFLRRAQ